MSIAGHRFALWEFVEPVPLCEGACLARERGALHKGAHEEV